MKYKIAANIINSSSQSFSLSNEELSSLTNGTVGSGIISISAGLTMVIECDLINRYSLSSIKYYHNNEGNVSVYVGESYNKWVQLSVGSFSGGSVISVSGYYPKYIRIVHEAAASTVIPYEIEVYNDDTNILFGSTGTISSYALDAYGDIKQEIKVYNNTNNVRTLYAFIDSDDSTDADNLLSLGTTSSGVFYGLHGNSLSLPGDFSWDSGKYIGTETNVGGYLSVSGTLASGTYYSPIINYNSYKNSRIYWESSSDGVGSIEDVSGNGSEDCLGVRLYRYPPSGTWSNGTLSDESDPKWSISSGSLEFRPIPNNSILEFRDNKYVQFRTTITGSAVIREAGIEKPLEIPNVNPNGSASFYVSSVSGTLNGKSSNILCWYKE